MLHDTPIREDFIHYLWKTKRVGPHFESLAGQKITIVDYGTYNLGAGPDFFNGKVEIDGTLWVGNIEMHVFTRDWSKHKHQHDDAYNNVILHVVYEHDGAIEGNETLPTIILKGNIPKVLHERYASLRNSQSVIPCEKLFAAVDKSKIDLFKDRLISERLTSKSKFIEHVHKMSMSSWEDATYIAIARYFGSKVNADPFEQLARSLPLSIIHKNRDKPISLEALIWGQSGMLSGNHKDEYFINLQREYAFLAKKYGLTSLDPSVWKFGKLRPINFPTIRIAQFAALLSSSLFLFSSIKETKDLKGLRGIFSAQPNEYWDARYQFGTESKPYSKAISGSFIDLILVNAVIPILYQYGKSMGSEELCDRAIEFLDKIKAETNNITSIWKDLGVNIKSAYDAQAMIELKTNYCDQFRCMECQVGHEIFKG